MQVHLVGAGSIGLIVALHLNKLAPVTLLLRDEARVQHFQQAGGCVAVEREGVTDRAPVTAEAVTTVHGRPQHRISNLLVTTKANQAAGVLTALRPRLDAASVVVLLVNGVLAATEEITRDVFPHPGSRPSLILGSTTHGAYRRAPFHVVHAGMGACVFGLPPPPLEPRAPDGGGGGGSSSSGGSSSQPGGGAERAAAALRPSVVSNTSGAGEASSGGAQRTDGDAAASVAAGSSAQQMLGSQAARVAEVMALLGGLTGLAPSVDVPPAELERQLLMKLVVNVCANPLTALLHCRNGGLIDNPHAAEAWAHIIAECKQVLGDRLPGSCEELHAHVTRVVGVNAANWNSMAQDVVHRNPTEMAYLNGYIVRHAREQGLLVPWNQVLCTLVAARTAVAAEMVTHESLEDARQLAQ